MLAGAGSFLWLCHFLCKKGQMEYLSLDFIMIGSHLILSRICSFKEISLFLYKDQMSKTKKKKNQVI